MTLESTVNRNRYVGNGAAVTFPFTFRIWKKDQVRVFVGNGLTETDVTSLVQVERTATGGTVTFNFAPPAGKQIVIRRNMPFVQEDDYKNGTRFDAEEVEDRFDQDCAERQDLSALIDRCVKVPETSTMSADDLIQTVMQALEYMREAGDVTGASLVKALGGEAYRSLASRFADWINVKDFGARGDGVTDDLLAFQAAAASGKQVFVPEGSYVLSEPVNYPNFIVGPGVTFPAETAYYKERDTTYRKAIVKELPYIFPDYDEALAYIRSQTGDNIPYVYPQGIGFDADGSLYMSYCHSGFSDISQGIVPIVKYNASFEYVGYAFVAYGLENVVLSDENGRRFLYHRRSYKNSLLKYDITSASWSGETLSGEVVLRDCDSNYWKDGNKWYALQIFPDLGQKKSRTTVSVYDENFNLSGSFSLPKTITGWQTNSDTYYPYVPKMQGFCISNGVVYVAHGGYASQTSGTPARVADIGCSAVSTDGSVLKYGVLDSARFTAKLRAMGYTVNRTEAEAGCVHPCGGIYGLYITQTHSDSAADEGGVLIVREFSEDGVDFSDCASTYVPFDLSRYSDAVFPRTGEWNDDIDNTQAAMRNPFTGEKITALSQLLDFVVESGIGRASFYTSAILLTTIDPIVLDSGMLVEIRNANNVTCEISTQSSGETGTRWYTANKGTGTWLAYNSYPKSKVFTLDVSEEDKLARIVSTNVDSTGGRNLLLGVTNNVEEPSSTLYLGGVSTVLRPVTYINCYVKDSSSDIYSASRILVMGGLAVAPGEDLDGTVVLGRASARWDVVYAATGSINTSDEREKQSIEAIPDAVMRAWGRVNFYQFKFSDAVQKKGEAARTHIGVIAQRIKEAFEAEDIDPFRYGLLCYDEWDAVPAQTDETGAVVVPAVPAGSRYSVRYEECLALECAYQRWRLEQMEERINQLTSNS